jgi:hypothetical protein
LEIPAPTEIIVAPVADIESSYKKPSQLLTYGVERFQQFEGEQLRPVAKFAYLTVISRFDQSKLSRAITRSASAPNRFK